MKNIKTYNGNSIGFLFSWAHLRIQLSLHLDNPRGAHRLKIRKPKEKSAPVKIIEYRMASILICPTPKTKYLNDSMTADIGLARIIHSYFSGTMDSGKMTGDAYISNRTPKPIRKRISRYFEVIAENKRPNPSP